MTESSPPVQKIAEVRQTEMASVKVLGNIPLASPCFDDLKKRKQKKAKKPKREKSDKHKSKPKGQQSLKDYSDICDSNFVIEWPEIKKKKRKKKHDGRLNEDFPLTQNKKLNVSKRHKKNRKTDRAKVNHDVSSGPAEQEMVQPIKSSIQKEKKHQKRVIFNLSPVMLEPKPVQDPFVMRDILQTQRSAIERRSVFNTVTPADGCHSKKTMAENVMESQSTSDDINSQDLFITQKTFSDPYIDLCSSTSAEEALEPHCYTETHPEHQSYTGSSAKEAPGELQSYTETLTRKRLCSEHQASPEVQASTASSAKKHLSSKPPSYTSSPRRIPQAYTSSTSTKWSCQGAQSSLKKLLCPSHQPSHHHKLDAFTQTENFFTSLLATSLRVHQQGTCPEEPMDLSLPNRSRLHPREAPSKTPGDQRQTNVFDLTQSDDSDSHLKSKADLSQLKVVQTRLNESFFFKLKGEADSPKPMSPLMKLAGSVEKKKP